MTYEKQNFQPEQVLTAEELNAMDDAIITINTEYGHLNETVNGLDNIINGSKDSDGNVITEGLIDKIDEANNKADEANNKADEANNKADEAKDKTTSLENHYVSITDKVDIIDGWKKTADAQLIELDYSMNGTPDENGLRMGGLVNDLLGTQNQVVEIENNQTELNNTVGNLNDWKSNTVEPQLLSVTSRVEAVENNAAKLVNTSSNSFILRLFNNDSFNDTFNVYVVSPGKHPSEIKFKKYDTVHVKGTYKFFGEKFQFKLGDNLTSDTIIYLKAFTVTNSDGDQFLIEPYENTFSMGTDKEINIDGTKYTVSDVCAYMGEGLSIDSTIKVRITELNTGGTNIVDIKYTFLQ